MNWYLVVGLGGLLHAVFAVCEMFPWSGPILLKKAAGGLPEGATFSVDQEKLVATIVHNAGIYNAVLALGFVWAMIRGESSNEVAFVMFLGAILAGVFGTFTLKSPVTAVQAAVGVVGAYYCNVLW